jgi:hypothetical protein
VNALHAHEPRQTGNGAARWAVLLLLLLVGLAHVPVVSAAGASPHADGHVHDPAQDEAALRQLTRFAHAALAPERTLRLDAPPAPGLAPRPSGLRPSVSDEVSNRVFAGRLADPVPLYCRYAVYRL